MKLASLLFVVTVAAHGGDLQLKSSVIAAGGASSRSADERFTLTGTIGQHTAGLAKGGRFALENGFWHGLAVEQTPGAPTLRIRLIAGGQAVLSWPKDVDGFHLEETTAVGSGVWNTVLTPVVDTTTEHTVTVLAVGVIKVYRLKKF